MVFCNKLAIRLVHLTCAVEAHIVDATSMHAQSSLNSHSFPDIPPPSTVVLKAQWGEETLPSLSLPLFSQHGYNRTLCPCLLLEIYAALPLWLTPYKGATFFQGHCSHC
jgi:hypothetical protein